MPSIGIILSGCGVNDGTEIHEAVITMLCLDKHNAELEFFAPEGDQEDVIDHETGIKLSETRNIKTESARISRGNIKSISKANPSELDAVILPGGFGAMKNLSKLYKNPKKTSVDKDLLSLLEKMHELKKPIGAICISPVVIAAALGKFKPELTIGNDRNTANIIESFGGTNTNCKAYEICFDEKNIIVSTPAYMLAKGPWQVYEGISKLVDKILNLI